MEETAMLKRVIVGLALVIVGTGTLVGQGRGGRGAGPGGTQGGQPKITALRAGRLIDPETGGAATNQIILVEGDHITNVSSNVPIPQGADVIDLSAMTVLPGFVDTHTHEAMTYKEVPENNIYYYTYIADPTPLRSIQAASNALQLLSSGFTVVCDVGNNGLYADTALRQAIEQGWIPGPTVIPSGLIISTTGGQFTPSPEMYKLHNIVYPEYLEANSHDEIVKAVRENLLFGAKVIKICLDCKPWGYSVDDIKLFISEAAKGGAKVNAHVQTRDGGQRAIDAGLHVISHGQQLTPEQHAQMAAKTIYLASTDTPFTSYRGSEQGEKHAAEELHSAWEKGVPVTFSTDMDYWSDKMKKEDGQWLDRGELTIAFLKTWKAAGIPAKDILKALTTNGYKAADVYKDMRGPIKAGYFADIVAVQGDPLTNIDAVRNVQFVMKNGEVFKRNGVITIDRLLHPGPVNGFRRR
jgi:imidazolonepropionase-like amidohydrolase